MQCHKKYCNVTKVLIADFQNILPIVYYVQMLYCSSMNLNTFYFIRCPPKSNIKENFSKCMNNFMKIVEFLCLRPIT